MEWTLLSVQRTIYLELHLNFWVQMALMLSRPRMGFLLLGVVCTQVAVCPRLRRDIKGFVFPAISLVVQLSRHARVEVGRLVGVPLLRVGFPHRFMEDRLYIKTFLVRTILMAVQISKLTRIQDLRLVDVPLPRAGFPSRPMEVRH